MNDVMRLAQQSAANHINALKVVEIKKLRLQTEAANHLKLAEVVKNKYTRKYHLDRAK